LLAKGPTCKVSGDVLYISQEFGILNIKFFGLKYLEDVYTRVGVHPSELLFLALNTDVENVF